MTLPDKDRYQVGKTKAFMRAGVVAYLEKLRGDKLAWAAISIQRIYKGTLYRRKYVRFIGAVRLL